MGRAVVRLAAVAVRLRPAGHAGLAAAVRPARSPNQAWAKDASALVVLISNSLMRRPGTDKDVLSPTHSFDAGTASGYVAVQALPMGWHVHGMVGSDRDRAFAGLNVPGGPPDRRPG